MLRDRLILRDLENSDLQVFFEQQLDLDANRMAAFAPKDPSDKGAFLRRLEKISADEASTIKTIVFDGRVAGYVAKFMREGKAEVSYWLGKDFWGKGIATQALTEFVAFVTQRPLYARTAKDNLASLRVLEKCGFCICGEAGGFADFRSEEVEEYILHYV